ncbi:hypothetical protein [Azohydromonas caseinilytica]|uniref:DUF11 domain-containing protein n=1 Tax=Azohydromonas caseinilytica TaxID=2728836 RepID=A0A848F9U4_9BURK|nr:hypothetical protein [Azohydromonas caseinilytica]NML16028.1 hypothetical protein [Azohydromonas caseinilytica]
MRNVVVHVTAGASLTALLLACGGLRGGEEGNVFQEARGRGPGLSLRAEASARDQVGGRERITLTLRNDGVETATHIRPLALPSHLQLLHDGCTAEPLPSAASCSYTLALDKAAAQIGPLALQVRYDYADMLDRSAGTTLNALEGPALLAARDAAD